MVRAQMKRIENHLGKHIPPVCLYREELLAIAAALTRDNGKLIVKTKEFEYESIDELVSNNEDTLDDLTLRRDKPYISVNFQGRGGVWLYAENESLTSRGIFSEIQEILHSKRRQSYFLLRRFINASGWFGSAGIGAFGVIGYWREALLCLLLVAISMGFIFIKPRSIVNRDSRSQKKNFLQRNSDQIVVALISAVVSVILTLVVTIAFPVGKL
jgi:hypothetical protein